MLMPRFNIEIHGFTKKGALTKFGELKKMFARDPFRKDIRITIVQDMSLNIIDNGPHPFFRFFSDSPGEEERNIILKLESFEIPIEPVRLGFNRK